MPTPSVENAAHFRQRTRRLVLLGLAAMVGGGLFAFGPWSLPGWAGASLYALLMAAGITALVLLQRAAARHAEQLECAADRFERVADTVPGILCQFELSADGRHARMPYSTRPLEPVFGLSASLEPGSADVMFRNIHPEDVERFRSAVLASAASLTPFAMEWRMCVPGQPERWVDVRSMPQRLPDGATLWTGFVADITEARAAHQAQLALDAAQRANRAKSEFLSRVSHELRTPLNAVIGFATLMLTDTRQALAPTQREYLGHIRQSGEHLLALINDLLDMSSIESGRIEAKLENVAADGLLDAVVAGLRDQAQRAGVALDPGRAPSGLGVRADPVRLKQVLFNLVSNAIKYNREGGTVTLRVTPDGSDVRIDVQDSGEGLSTEQQAHLFEPFNRLGAERRRIPGTGIGLTISKFLVELMGGRIAVTSTPGHGSLFSVRLPAAPCPPAAAAT